MERLLVIGIGAMASLVGAHLARSGQASVTLAGTWDAALSAIRQHGITVCGEHESWNVPVQTASRTSHLEGFDAAVVLVKSFQTQDVAPVAAAAVRRGGLILTLQNGLGNREALEQAARGAHVSVGLMTIGATLVRPGCIRPFAGRIIIGATDRTREPLEVLAQIFTDGGVDVLLTDAIEEYQWQKLAANCAINPLSAILGVTNGALVERPDWLETMTAAAREVGEVAAARGLSLGPDAAVARAVQIARDSAGNRSSMLQDLTRGSRTEIDAMNGAVCREAARLGLPTPTNQRLYDAIKDAERQRGITSARFA